MDPFLGQIVMFGGNFAPRHWAFCHGQLLPINQNDALFSILGTMYGGDGRTSFALPDLRGRSPRGVGEGPGLRDIRYGERGGSEFHTLSIYEMPTHNHTATLHGELKAGDRRSPQGSLLAFAPSGGEIYTAPDPVDNRTMAPESIVVANTGGNQSFDIMNPYTAVNFIIALQGTYPSRN